MRVEWEANFYMMALHAALTLAVLFIYNSCVCMELEAFVTVMNTIQAISSTWSNHMMSMTKDQRHATM
jgi:hypothetical protein